MPYQGRCYCGSVQFETQGEPLFTQHCHCNKCRSVAEESSDPSHKIGYSFTAAYLTKNFKITQGQEHLVSTVRNHARLYLCAQCRSLIYGLSEDPEQQQGLGINAHLFQFSGPMPETFQAVRHIWYQDRIVDVDDPLPKFKDAPQEQGGTGALI